jgi:hypothetical protein
VGIKAFNALAGYIFGGNASGTKMAMTTPVFSSTDGTMEFVVSAKAEQVGWRGGCLMNVVKGAAAEHMGWRKHLDSRHIRPHTSVNLTQC